MQEVCVISYRLNECNSAQKTAVQRGLNGHLDYSNNGFYLYKRKGILKEIPNQKIAKGVIIISLKDKPKVISLLRNNKAWYKSLSLLTKKKILR